jgi:hypothetical protein
MAEVKQIEPTIKKPEFKRLPLDSNGKLIKKGPLLKSPTNLLIVKYPKSGGTLSLCNVPKVLIADAERGTKYFNADNVTNLLDEDVADKYVETKKYGWIPQTLFDLVTELDKANNMTEYWKMYTAMEKERDPQVRKKMYEDLVVFINNMPFPILAIDTITSVTELSNKAALYEYNQNVRNPKVDIKKVDDYGGVKYIRNKFSEIKAFIEQNAAPFIQFHGHVGQKKKVMKKDDEDITALDIALEGLMSTTFTSKADAVATFYRNENGCFLDFSKKEETDLGSRPTHLANKVIKIADLVSDKDLEAGLLPKSYWQEIYPEIKF